MLISLLLAAATATAAAPHPPGVCAAIASQIDSAQMNTSANSADDITDDSAPRATSRHADDTSQMVSAQANLALIAEHHCPAYSHPINLNAYIGPALDCRTARLRDPDGATAKTACDRTKWTRAD